MKDYEISSVPCFKKPVREEPKKSDPKKDLAKMNREREEKIRRYKESKALECSLKELKFAIEKPSCDDDVLRDYYLKMIRKFTFSAMDELSSFETEKEILQHMAKMRESGSTISVNSEKEKPKRPLKPIVITRDAIQKEIFGMGYKNLPVFSIEEFYEQRVRDGWFPSSNSNQQNRDEFSLRYEAKSNILYAIIMIFDYNKISGL